MTTKHAITREQALSLRDRPVGQDDQFMRRISFGGERATVISHFCCVAGRYSGCVHIDGEPVTTTHVASWW